MNIDNQCLAKVNNGLYVGGYYKRFVNKRVKTLEPLEVPNVHSILHKHTLDDDDMNLTSPGFPQQPGMINNPPNFNKLMPPV